MPTGRNPGHRLKPVTAAEQLVTGFSRSPWWGQQR